MRVTPSTPVARSSVSKAGSGVLSSLPGAGWGRRLLWGAGVLAVLVFAVQGGEYGTSDLYRQRRGKAALESELAELRDSVAALQVELKAVRTDPLRLERLAREEYGMVRGNKEILYRLKRIGSDSVQGDESLWDLPFGVDSGEPVANVPRLPRGGAVW